MNKFSLFLKKQYKFIYILLFTIFSLFLFFSPAYTVQSPNDPVADFEADQTLGCPGLVVKFTDKSENADQWIWSFPGGNPSAAQGQGPHEVTYANIGTYDVTLEVYSSQGGSDQEYKSNYIQINDCSPVANFKVYPESGCVPLVVTYTDQSTNAETWIWSFPGGSPSATQTKGPHQVTYTQEGTYGASLTVANAYAQHTREISDIVNASSCTYEFGDAPEGVVAYPSSGVIGNFPTCKYVEPAGYIRHDRDSGTMLGYDVDFETDGNEGWCPTFYTDHYDEDESCDEVESCLVRPDNYTIIGAAGSEIVVPFCVDEEHTLGGPCGIAVWGYDINVVWQTDNIGGAFVNILIDFNQDGEWGASGTCTGGQEWNEHVLVNFPVPEGNGHLVALDPPSFRIGPNSGYVWMRVTITDEEIDLPWDGSGIFDSGETEDHLIRISEVIDLIDYGDAPAPFKTMFQENGARHVINPDIYMGSGVSTDDDGVPDSLAATDDDDGVTFQGEWIAGDTIIASITVSDTGYLSVWGSYDTTIIDIAKNVELMPVPALDSSPDSNSMEPIVFAVPIPVDASEGPAYIRFRFSTEPIDFSYGLAPDGEVEDYRVTISGPPIYDFGDAPENDTLHYETTLANNGARNIVCDTIYIGWGLIPTAEPDGQPSIGADADDALSEENGISFYCPLSPGEPDSIRVTMFGPGYLHGWIDFNRDGDWDDSGEYFVQYDNSSAPVFPDVYVKRFFAFMTPETAVPGRTYARFRYCTDPPPFTPDGPGGRGEVEDYDIYILEYLYDYGDAPDSYNTTGADAARHPVMGPRLGLYVDSEPDGQPGIDADGDDTDSDGDDDDGVAFTPIIPGESTLISVGTLAEGFLYAWIDFNIDGDWDDPGENIIAGMPGVSGDTLDISIDVPSDAVIGDTYARFRYITNWGMSLSLTPPFVDSYGPSLTGEVEDYKIRIGPETGINQEKSNTIPIEYALQQNYPNPFNPETQIQFSVPEPVQVHLTIYNLYGQQVCEIVNEKKLAGSYTATWNGKNELGQQVGSGIYIMHLQAGKFKKTRKVIFMK